LADSPRRGEVWLVAPGAGRAGEPGKTRPAVVVSSDHLTTGAPDELVIVVPVSSSRAPSALRIEMGPEAGLERPSRAICRAVRAVVASRLVRRIGHVDQPTMEQVQDALTMILELGSKPNTG
jgi:mRNA interferase MazF